MPTSDRTGRAVAASPQKLLHVQILRGVAAASVVLFHCIGNARAYTGDQEHWLLRVFEHGGYGVDLFFVISGFIIYSSTRASGVTRREFLTRRLERIVPLYWMLTGALLVAALVFPSLFTSAGDFLGLRAVESFLFLSFVSPRATPIIYPGWSLEFEMLFYLVVALLLQPSEKMWSHVVCVLSISTIFHVAPLPKTLGVFQDFFTHPRILEFGYGVLAAQIFARRFPVGPLAIAAVATSTVAAAGYGALIRAGLLSTLLVLVAALWSVRDRPPTAIERICAQIGDASYSIYLTQVFAIAAVNKTLMRLRPSIDLLILAEAGLSILAGYAIFRLLEQPLLATLRKARSERRGARDAKARPERVI